MAGDAGIIAGGCLALIIAVAIGAALGGWIIMLLWGAIAGALGKSTIGYGTAVLISLALSVIGSYFRSYN